MLRCFFPLPAAAAAPPPPAAHPTSTAPGVIARLR